MRDFICLGFIINVACIDYFLPIKKWSTGYSFIKKYTVAEEAGCENIMIMLEFS